MSNESLTYAKAVSELDGIVREIETETVDVDHLAEKVKRAAFLISTCKAKLKSTEDEVKNVLRDIEAEASQETNSARELEMF